MELPKRNSVVSNLEIVDIAKKGKSVGKLNGGVIFVNGAVPGDVVDAKITKRKKSYAEATPVAYQQYSPHRTTPFCEHFDYCGGCKWQHIEYESQLQLKQKYVYDNLTRIGQASDFEFRDILPAPYARYYRNRLDFAFTNKRWLTEEEKDSGLPIEDRTGVGLHVPGRFDKVIDINHCYLQKAPSNDIRLKLKEYARKQGYSFYDIVNHEGLLRSLIIRTTNKGELMVILMLGKEDEEATQDLMNFLKTEFPEITALYYVINDKANDTFYDLPVHHYGGNPYIEEDLNGLMLRLGPKSFYQTNSEGALQLFDTVSDFAGIQPHETVYDLYTGIGSIALYVANQAKEVIGIETVEEATRYAKYNASLNQINNASFYAGEIRDVMTEDFLADHAHPDVLITDPPRDGMHPKVVKSLLEILPQRIVYVSCNPSTQGRDIAELQTAYDVIKAQPIDMFPHTFHVENVLLLERKPQN